MTGHKSLEQLKEEVDKAVEFAENSEFPVPEDALSDLFANDTGYDYI